MSRPQAKEQLPTLLASLFDPEETIAWFRYADILDSGITSGSRAIFFASLVLRLDRHGRVDDEFWRFLHEQRPGRANDINATRAAWEGDRPGALGEASRVAGIRVAVDELEALLNARDRGTRLTARQTSELDEHFERVKAWYRELSNNRKIAEWSLLRVVGSGMFGTIWLARSGEREAAIKVLKEDQLLEPLMLWHFRTSIKAVRSLTKAPHCPPSIVPITWVSEDTLAYAMPYFEGGTLEALPRRRYPLTVKLSIFDQCCRAVEHAHTHGVIHRDIKPSNVLLDGTNAAVTDFDIAHVAHATKLSIQHGLGTSTFAAPEQVENEALATVRSDVYSLGRLLYFMLAERPPSMLGDSNDYQPVGHLTGALLEVVVRACEWHPEERFDSVAAFRAEVANHATVRGEYVGVIRRATRWLRRHGTFAALAAIVISTVLSFVWGTRKLAEAQSTSTRAGQASAAFTLEKEEVVNLLRGAIEERSSALRAVRREASRSSHPHTLLDLASSWHSLRKVAEEPVGPQASSRDHDWVLVSGGNPGDRPGSGQDSRVWVMDREVLVNSEGEESYGSVRAPRATLIEGHERRITTTAECTDYYFGQTTDGGYPAVDLTQPSLTSSPCLIRDEEGGVVTLDVRSGVGLEIQVDSMSDGGRDRISVRISDGQRSLIEEKLRRFPVGDAIVCTLSPGRYSVGVDRPSELIGRITEVGAFMSAACVITARSQGIASG